MQQDRLKNPHPWTYEIPLAIVLTLVLVAVLGVHTGRAVANLLAGGGWGWPPATELFRSLPGVQLGSLGPPPARSRRGSSLCKVHVV